MDNKFDKHRVGDRYNSTSEDPHHYSSSNRQFRSGSNGPVHHYGQENYRGRSGGHVSPNYRSGVSSSSGGDGKELRRPFDSPPRYPLPPSGGDGGFEGGLRPIGDGIGGFRPMIGGGSGGEGFRPMGERSGEGFSPIGGRSGEGFRPMGGRSGEGFPPLAGNGGEGFWSMGGRSGEGFPPLARSSGEGFRPMGGSGGEGFRPMSGSGGEGIRPMGRRSAEGFRLMDGNSGEGFPSMGGSGRGFPPMRGVVAGEFRPMGAGDSERLWPTGGGDGDRFLPVGSGSGDGGGFGLDNNCVAPVSLTGQKRGYSFSGRERSPDRSDGGSFAKLFVGSVPRTATEEDIRPLFDKHGRVLEVALIKDKRTGQQQGCCFIKYVSSEEADRAIRALHNQYTLPGGVGPIQVRYADGERERLGATEYKLFVGSLNKQATEKEVEEIFQPYGRVEDVYLMRDEMKQSRGCGFVKYSQKEMAQAAINALNGAYTMRGCDQPLTVRFADPKRPRPAESRSPAFGGLGFGPRFSAPGIRPPPDLGEPHLGHIPPNSWRSVSPQNMGPASSVGIHGFGNQLPSRAGDAPVSSTPGAVGGFPGNVDGSLPGPTVSSVSMPQLNFNQSLPQIPSFGSKISPGQRPYLSPQHMPSSLQLQPPNVASFTNVNSLQGSHMQLGPVQMPHTAGQAPVSQAPPARPLPGLNGQLPVRQPQVKHNASLAPEQGPGLANKQQLPSQQHQPLHQSPSQLAQMLSQQKQTLQATFQSSQQAFNQLQQQVQQLQPTNQNFTSHQGPQATKQQSPWPGIASEPAVNTPVVQQAGDVAPTTTASLAAPALNPAVATVNCNWTEHTSPDGYKYYYNSSTGESKWEKPEELTQYEQPQQHQKLHSQHSQVHSQSQGLSMQQSPQLPVQLQGQHQAQLNQIQPLQRTSQSSSYHVHGVSAKQSSKELGYSQIPGGTGPVNDPARYQQHLHASQEWMWKNKPSGT